MFKANYYQEHSPVCNFVPGFAFYDGIGNGLAEAMIDFIEGIADLIGRFRI